MAFTLSLVLLVLTGTALRAQDANLAASSILSGTIVDPHGNGVANATVSIRSEAGGSPHTVTTDDQGRFAATQLTPGRYTVEVSANGFTSATRKAVQIDGSPVSLSIALSLAAERSKSWWRLTLPAPSLPSLPPWTPGSTKPRLTPT
jgi:hypothetical protein